MKPLGWGLTRFPVAPLRGVAWPRSDSNRGMKSSNLLSLSYGEIVRKDIGGTDGLLPESFETYQIVRAGDVVMRLTDLQNDRRSLRSGLVREDGIITSAYLAVTPLDIEPRFLSFALRAADVSKAFYAMGGGLRQSLGWDELKSFALPLPGHAEQVDISDFLDRETAEIDSFIEDQQRLLSLLGERRASTVTRALLLTPNKDVALRHAYSVLDCKHLTAPEFEVGFPLISVREVQTKYVTWASARRTDEETFATLSEGGRALLPEDLVVCRNASVGKASLVPAGAPPLAMGQDVSLVRSRRFNSTAYLQYVLTSSIGVQAFDSASIGSTFRRINVDAIKALRIPLPSVDDQHHIVKILDRETAEIDAVTADAREAIALSKERRSALIAAAVTGKIDVTRQGVRREH